MSISFMTVGQEIVLGTIARVYKAAEIVSKRLAAAKAKPSKAFSALIQNIGTKMNESMYCAIFRYCIVHDCRFLVAK
jgi:hypothetical protein